MLEFWRIIVLIKDYHRDWHLDEIVVFRVTGITNFVFDGDEE